MKKTCALLLTLCIGASLLAPIRAQAAAAALPGVTEEMMAPAFWSGQAEDPDRLLATSGEIAALNAAALTTEGSNMHDLKGLDGTFNGAARVEALKKSVAADGAYYLGWTYDETGKALEQADFDAIAANCSDPEAGETMAVRYGVTADRTTLLTFPYDGQILDDPADFDFDYQALVGLPLNEPVAVFTTSADGKYYHVYTSCCSGWLPVEDVALCRDREEWLSAWDLPPEKRLVFWGDKMYTDYSKTAPETSRRLITMGAVLERMDLPDESALVINRLPLHNYPVYLPVRNEDGSYDKRPALINAREKVSEDYLPLTPENLAAVALASLGDAYGWGGSLNNEDCSSLNRSVYRCFGLDLPRNGNWQWTLSLPKADVTGMTAEEKEALLDKLPLGTLLNFPGHQMFYLGRTEDGYFVVSAVSKIMNPHTGKAQRTRDVQINDLNVKRANGQTWLQAVDHIYLPWQSLPEGLESPMPGPLWYHDGAAFCLEKDLMDAGEGGRFRPNDPATRAEAVDLLWRAAGKPEADAAGFSDLDGGADCLRAALWAQARGLVRGVNGAFLPDGALTREQLAVLLHRLAGGTAEEESVLADYTDADAVSPWAKDAMAWAVGRGLLKGRSAGVLAPDAPVTRAELAVIAQRSFQSGEDRE